MAEYGESDLARKQSRGPLDLADDRAEWLEAASSGIKRKYIGQEVKKIRAAVFLSILAGCGSSAHPAWMVSQPEADCKIEVMAEKGPDWDVPQICSSQWTFGHCKETSVIPLGNLFCCLARVTNPGQQGTSLALSFRQGGFGQHQSGDLSEESRRQLIPYEERCVEVPGQDRFQWTCPVPAATVSPRLVAGVCFDPNR